MEPQVEARQSKVTARWTFLSLHLYLSFKQQKCHLPQNSFFCLGFMLDPQLKRLYSLSRRQLILKLWTGKYLYCKKMQGFASKAVYSRSIKVAFKGLVPEGVILVPLFIWLMAPNGAIWSRDHRTRN